MDGSGNLFVDAYDWVAGGGEAVQELTAASSYNTGRTLTTLTTIVDALAVDGAGNLFILDTPNLYKYTVQEVRELLAEGDYTTTRILIKDVDFNGMAIDGGGNLFFTSRNDGVQEYLAADGYTTAKAIGSGFSQADGLATDGSGNLFVGDRGSNSIKEVFAAGGYTTIKTLTSNIQSPAAVDAAGDIFFIGVGQDNQRILGEIVAAGGYTTVNTLFSRPVGYDPLGVAIDGNGNVFTALDNFTSILELLRLQPPSLEFTPANVDTSDSPMSVTAQNVGNAALTASALAFTDSDDFTLTTGSGTPPDCTSSFSLASGAECNLRIDFTPASAGTLNGSLLLTDNSGNATAATQSIALSGNGITPGGPVAHVSTTALNYGSIASGASATKSLIITNTGGGRLAISPSTTSLDYKITGNTCSAGITTGSCVLQVAFAPTSVGSHLDHLTLATNGQTNPIIPITGTATGIYVLGPYEASVTSIDFGTIYFPSRFNTTTISIADLGVPGPVPVKTSIDGPDYRVTENGCLSPGVMPASVSCGISIEFSPLTLGGHWEHLTLTPSVGPPITLELTGIAAGTL